jgi:hypothetical protein
MVGDPRQLPPYGSDHLNHVSSAYTMLARHGDTSELLCPKVVISIATQPDSMESRSIIPHRITHCALTVIATY